MVVGELGGEAAATLGDRLQVGRVPLNFGSRDGRVDHGLSIVLWSHAVHVRALAVQVAHDVAGVLIGNRDLQDHDRLEKGRLRLEDALLERLLGSDLERHFIRVDVVIAAVVQRDLHIDDWISCYRSCIECLANSLIDRREEVARHRATNDPVAELEIRIGQWLDLKEDMTVLTRTSGLLLMLVLGVGFASSWFRGTQLGEDRRRH